MADNKVLILVKASNYQHPAFCKNKNIEIYATAEELFVSVVFTEEEIVACGLSIVIIVLLRDKSRLKIC